MKVLYEAHDIKHSRPYIYHENGHGAYSHWHENIEILLYTENSTVFCDRNEINVKAGEIVVFGSNAIHTIPHTEESKYNCFIIDASFCLENEIDLSAISFDVHIKDEVAKRLYLSAVEEINSTDEYSKSAAKAAILNFMVYLCRNHSRRSGPATAKESNIKKAITHINSNYNKKMSIDELANISNLSKYYFCREFKKVTGFSVIQYINLIRCRNAEKMLLTQNCTVSEAASSSGYDNLSYFTRTFKSIIGHLPVEIKNQ